VRVHNRECRVRGHSTPRPIRQSQVVCQCYSLATKGQRCAVVGVQHVNACGLRTHVP
jgi:hypothetical protein